MTLIEHLKKEKFYELLELITKDRDESLFNLGDRGSYYVLERSFHYKDKTIKFEFRRNHSPFTDISYSVCFWIETEVLSNYHDDEQLDPVKWLTDLYNRKIEQYEVDQFNKTWN